MSALIFTDRHLLASSLVGADGVVHYTTSTTGGNFRGRKITTIVAAGGRELVGLIDWRGMTLSINGVQRKFDDVRAKSGMFSSEQEWDWGHRPYKLKYDDSHKELLAIPPSGSAHVVRFTPFQGHLLHTNKPAAIYFPPQLQDEEERMFVLMAILETEIEREEKAKKMGDAGNVVLGLVSAVVP
ncbi:hypothetical protein FB451DRAFT_1172820 [Mycena latifolia]|nr:hypothetical protein FB451DRAFT_1172820 [Mycena latifolia]